MITDINLKAQCITYAKARLYNEIPNKESGLKHYWKLCKVFQINKNDKAANY